MYYVTEVIGSRSYYLCGPFKEFWEARDYFDRHKPKESWWCIERCDDWLKANMKERSREH